MTKEDMMHDLVRYGKIKADFDNTAIDVEAEYIRVRVFEYQGKKYFTVMCDGEPLRCEEV